MAVFFIDSEKLNNCAINGTGWLNFPALNFFESTKIIKVNFCPQDFKLTKTEQNKGFLSISESTLKLLNCQLFQGVFCLPLNPFINLLFAESSMINLPVATSDISIDRERRIRSI